MPPEIVFDEGLGNLFVVRGRGQHHRRRASLPGSLEYSISILGSVVIVVLGHEECGAVKAAIDVATKGTDSPATCPRSLPRSSRW